MEHQDPEVTCEEGVQHGCKNKQGTQTSSPGKYRFRDKGTCHTEILTSSLHCLPAEQCQGPFQPSGFMWKLGVCSSWCWPACPAHVAHGDCCIPDLTHSPAEETNPVCSGKLLDPVIKNQLHDCARFPTLLCPEVIWKSQSSEMWK